MTQEQIDDQLKVAYLKGKVDGLLEAEKIFTETQKEKEND